jgi:plastocyanin
MRSWKGILLGLVVGLPAGPTLAGDLLGEVRFNGPAPVLAPLKVNRDQRVCGKTVDDQSLLVSGGYLENVVVSVHGQGAAAPAPQAAKVELDQRLCRYLPHVQAVAVGSTLEIINSDPMLHNSHARTGAQTIFNLAMPTTGMRIPRVLAKAERVRLKCDVHSFMEAWVVVADGPAAVVGKDGRYELKGLPAGAYTVTAWHEKLGERTAQVQVPASGQARQDFAFGR